MTDIGSDPDDIQSLRRLLVYANDFRIEGLIATATHGPKEGRKAGVYYTFENIIHAAIDDYEKVRDRLLLHAPEFPAASALRAVVKGGQPNRGVANLKPENSTAGTKHIVAVVDGSDDLTNIAIWGGAHDLAQALLDVRTNRSAEEVNTFVSKIRVYAIADQDIIGPVKGTGEWIRENFPRLRYVESGPPWNAVITASFRGMYQNESAGGEHPTLPLVQPGKEKLNDVEWVKANVLPWGPLGAGYPPDLNQNPKAPRNTRGVKEGDTPSWFFFLSHGLNDPAHPEWGGWGGRFMHNSGGHYIDAQDDHWSGHTDAALRRKWTVARWREAFQNDFAARMRWCQLSYQEANHNPVAIIDGDASREVLTRKVKPGEKISLDASSSRDPDGDKLTFNWWIYMEASSAMAIVKKANSRKVTIEVPASTQAGNIHAILELTDNSSPKLFAYRRVILKVGE